jgi:hypothetical protein
MKEIYKRNIKNLLKMIKKMKLKKNKMINIKYSSEEELREFFELLLEIWGKK